MGPMPDSVSGWPSGFPSPLSSRLAAAMRPGGWSLRAIEPVLVDRAALRPFCGAFRGAIDERRSRRRWSWRGTGEEFRQIVGLRHAQPHVAWGSRRFSSGSASCPGGCLSASGEKRNRIVSTIDVWSNSVRKTEPGSVATGSCFPCSRQALRSILRSLRFSELGRLTHLESAKRASQLRTLSERSADSVQPRWCQRELVEQETCTDVIEVPQGHGLVRVGQNPTVLAAGLVGDRLRDRGLRILKCRQRPVAMGGVASLQVAVDDLIPGTRLSLGQIP